MGRRSPKVQRSAEEKFTIVVEGLQPGKVSRDRGRKHGNGLALFYRCKDEIEKAALAALGYKRVARDNCIFRKAEQKNGRREVDTRQNIGTFDPDSWHP